MSSKMLTFILRTLQFGAVLFLGTTITFSCKADFWGKVQAYQLFYNIVRPNYSKGGKTPAQMIFEERPNINSEVLHFPVLDLDKLVCLRLNQNFSPDLARVYE